VAELSAKLDRLNICFSPINRPEDLFDDPHVLRPGGLCQQCQCRRRGIPRPGAADRVERRQYRAKD